MTQVHLQLLGVFCLTVASKPVTTLDKPRLRALLAYLALHHHAAQTRQHLAFLFWPDSTEAQALTNLRKQLYFLSNAQPTAEQLLHVTRQTVQWSPDVELRLDVAEFEALLAHTTTPVTPQVLDRLRQALDLYRGDLLPECYDEWIFAKREALREQYAGGLARLVLLLEEQRDYPTAISYAQRLLRHDPLHESTYRALIRLYALHGDRAAALRTYHICVTQLREELGVDPDDETQRAYERLLQGEVGATHQPELVANAPFVGRQHEWQQLQSSWRLAMRGQPQFVLIAGEAGIGKTRLAEELLIWAIHQGFATARARCYAAEGRLTYAPIIEWLRSDPLRAQRANLEPTWRTELARLLPEMLTDDPALPHPQSITQSWQRHHLFEAATRALLVAEQPLLLLLDDLQWCDKETLELLHFLMRNAIALGQPKLLLLGTARLPDEVDATHPLYELLNPLRTSDMLTQIDLARLNEAESSELARQMAKGELDSQTLRQLFADTAGNPLFVVETMRSKQGKSALNGSAEKTTTAVILPSAESAAIVEHLPPKVLAVIQARLGHLSATARELCEWAAVVGRAFTLDLLASASKITPDKAVSALDELWQRRIIREQGADAYDFSHDRLRDVAAVGISRVRRRYLHRCVAEALENENASQLDNIAAQIAAHYDAAGIIQKATDYYERAAKHAPQVFANDEAVAYLQRAITLLKTLPESRGRDQRELAFLTALGPPLAAVTNFSTARLPAVYEHAYVLARRLGVPLHPSLLRILAVHKGSRHDFAQAEKIGQQMLELAHQPDASIDKVVYLEGSYVLGVTAFWQGHFTQARAYLQQVVDSYALVQQGHHLAEYGQDTGIISRTRLGWTLWYLGYADQARQQCAISVEFASQLRHPFTLSLVLAYSTECACTCRDVVATEKLICRRKDMVGSTSAQSERLISFHTGWLSLLHGNVADGLQRFHEYAIWERENNPKFISLSYHLALLSEADRQAGNYQQGLVTLAEAFATLDGNQNYWHIAEMHRLKGELLLGQGDQLADAEAYFQQALEIARGQAAKSLELRAVMSLARLWDQQGKRSEARILLAEVYNWFTEGFDTADLQEAQALLEQLV